MIIDTGNFTLTHAGTQRLHSSIFPAVGARGNTDPINLDGIK